jgi:deazaflavin-dependent oxidoreductase (nitroreductase family)
MEIRFQQRNHRRIRANAGKVGGQPEGAADVVVDDWKSGQPRTNPLVYLADAGRYVIIASYAGAPTNPPWYHNLIANPVADIEVGAERFKVRAEVSKEPERSRLYAAMAAAMPAFSDYAKKTTRTIPVIALHRV